MRYIPALDGLRAVAVALVVASHAANLPAGYIGVDIFFVLSGFLITSLLIAEHRDSGRISLLNFYMRRALRLFPCLWLMIGVVLLSSWMIHMPERFSSDAFEALFALGYVENWRLIRGSPGSPFQHTWSLAIEEQFYIVWAIALGLLLNRSRRVVAVLAVLLIAAGGLCAALWGAGASWLRIYAGSDARAFELLAGAVLGSLYCHGTLQWASEAYHRAIACSAVSALIALPAITCLAAPAPEGTFLLTQLLTVSATAIVLTDVCAGSGSWAALLLSCRPLVYIGSISYGIYLWHDPLSWLAYEHGAAPLSRILIVAGGGVILAAASYRYVEAPALALKRRITIGRQASPGKIPAARAA